VLDGELLQAQGLTLTEYSVLVNLSEEPGRSAFAEAMSGIAGADMGPPIRRTTPASPA
jgi:DNA-binding MarR family transcriptional regulator